MTADEVIEDVVLEMTAAKMKDFAERRLGQGVSNDQLNAEMKDLIPEINVWRRRQRMLLRIFLFKEPPTQTIQ